MFDLRVSSSLAASFFLLAACGGPDPSGGEPGGPDQELNGSEVRGLVPEFGGTRRRFTVIGTEADGLSVPRDLAFNPANPSELWTVNRATDGTVIFFDPGTPSQRSEARVDAHANHFMEEVSSIAFGANRTFATCQESQNTYNRRYAPNNFMGPTLWPSELSIYATVNQEPSSPLGGSHLDMLHESPLCMGIAHESGNKYWVFDGYYGHLVRYDFNVPHEPGGDDHGDGEVERFVEAEVHYLADVPGHLELDAATGWLYVADPGAGRVIRVDTNSATQGRDILDYAMEPLVSYEVRTGLTIEEFATGLSHPSGLALDAGRIFVGDNATGEIIAFDARGNELDRLATPARSLMGIAVGPDGKLWYVDGSTTRPRVVRVDP